MANDEPPPPPELTERIAADGEVVHGYTLPDLVGWIRATHGYHISRLMGMCDPSRETEAIEQAFKADAMLRVTIGILIEMAGNAADAMIDNEAFRNDRHRDN